jgi:hypothetical protein
MKLLTFSRQFAAAAALAFIATGAASAGTLGDTVNATYYFPDSGTVYSDMGTAVVTGAGADYALGGYFQLHVTDTQIIADHFAFDATWNSAAFNGFKVTDLTKNFSGTYSIASSTLSGFSLSNVSVNGNVAEINWAGVSFTTDSSLVLNISAVPEPATYGMLVAGLGLLGVVARRRKA